MIVALLGLPVALQAVLEVVQQLGDFHVADRMMPPGQFLRNRPGALTRPPQRRLRVAQRLILDHGLQGVHDLGIGHRDRFATRSRAADAARRQDDTLSNLPDALGHRFT